MDTKQLVPAQNPQVAITPLPLAVKTLIIDGKRMTAAFFRQIVEQDLINEHTGELQGIPLGYVNVHQKDTCPECPHRHVLWMQEEKQLLRHAITVEPEDAVCYQELRDESQQKRDSLMDLLAMLLVHTHRTPDHTYWDNLGFGRRVERISIVIADEKLSVNASVSEHLAQLEQARVCLEQETQQGKEGSKDESSNNSFSMLAHDLDTARFVRRQFAQEGILLTHPKLYKLPQPYEHEKDALIRLNSYSSSRGKRIQHTRSVKENWFIYKDVLPPASQSQEQLYWRSTQHASDNITDEVAETVEAKLQPSIRALRLLLAEQITDHQLKKVDEQADALAQELGLPIPTEEGWQTSLQLVRDRLAEERQQFQSYTKRWKLNLASLETLEQLYIV
jgi:hypothetical protein